MRRVMDFRENAKSCRELAPKMPTVQREQLLRMAEEGERLADERERAVAGPEDPGQR